MLIAAAAATATDGGQGVFLLSQNLSAWSTSSLRCVCRSSSSSGSAVGLQSLNPWSSAPSEGAKKRRHSK